MDARCINPFLKSVSNTLGTMCGLKVRFGQPELQTESGPITNVSSVIGFSGDAAGCVVLDLPFETASKIAGKFAGVDLTPQDEDFADALVLRRTQTLEF